MINRMNLIQIERQDPGFKRGTPGIVPGVYLESQDIPESWEKGTGLSTFLAFFYEASRGQIKWWDLNKGEYFIVTLKDLPVVYLATKKWK